MTSMRPLLVSGLLLLAVGCSGGNGSGDAGTGTDGTAADGTNERSMIDTCEGISTEYASAITKAEECTLGAAQQCMKSVIGSFFCQCHVFVNGNTDTLAAIGARFTAAGCQRVCNGSCAMEVAASCRADSTSSTGARCLPALPDGGP
jgi:hypothetical protein